MTLSTLEIVAVSDIGRKSLSINSTSHVLATGTTFVFFQILGTCPSLMGRLYIQLTGSASVCQHFCKIM